MAKARGDSAGLDEAGVVEQRLPAAAVKTVTIRCSECAAEVDRVEWREYEGPPPAVSLIMAALSLDEKAARKVVEENNPAALLDPRENAEALTADILARNVADRPDDTYQCPNGHDADLEIAK